MIGAVHHYLKRVMTSLSILLNVLLGGDNNQTFSARNYEWKRRGLPNMSILVDFIFGKDHCLHCWVYWKVRK
jgi:hypothetical protein